MRYFIRGLGVGIIITALLLCIFYRKQMSDSAIIGKARRLGMEFVKTESVVSAAAISATPTPRPTETPVATSAGVVTPTEKTSAKPASTSKPATPTPKPTIKSTQQPTKKSAAKKRKRPKVNYHYFTVRSGMASDTIASQMQKAGIIGSAKGFDNYLTRKGHADRIMTGRFKIPKGATYAEVARIITN